MLEDSRARVLLTQSHLDGSLAHPQGVQVLSMRNKANRLEELFVGLTTQGKTGAKA